MDAVAVGVSADGERVRPWALDVDVACDTDLALGQPDRPGETRERDDVGAGGSVGVVNRLTQGAVVGYPRIAGARRGRVAGVVDREGVGVGRRGPEQGGGAHQGTRRSDPPPSLLRSPLFPAVLARTLAPERPRRHDRLLESNTGLAQPNLPATGLAETYLPG
jgi:hypothetical protein